MGAACVAPAQAGQAQEVVVHAPVEEGCRASHSDGAEKPLTGEEAIERQDLRVLWRRIDADGKDSISKYEFSEAVKNDRQVAALVFQGGDTSRLHPEKIYEATEDTIKAMFGDWSHIGYGVFANHFRVAARSCAGHRPRTPRRKAIKFQVELEGKWNDFGPEEDFLMKQAFLLGQWGCEFQFNKIDYEIDFERMLQKNLRTQRERRIRKPPKLERAMCPSPSSARSMAVIAAPKGSAGREIEITMRYPGQKGQKIMVSVPPGARDGQRMAVALPGPVEGHERKPSGFRRIVAGKVLDLKTRLVEHAERVVDANVWLLEKFVDWIEDEDIIDIVIDALH